jgi:TolA-binding protein
MTQLHPEELFELERQASLTESERALRDQHLASCQTCRIEHGLRADFAREPLHRDDDRALLERALGGALANLAAPALGAGSRKAWAVTAAGVLVAALAAAAVRSSGSGHAPPTPARAPAPALPPAERAKPSSAALPPPSAVASAKPTPRVARPPSSNVPRAADSAVSTSAAELFAQANAARRAGALSDASSLYRQLLGQFGDSREAQTSSVILGRLLLDSGDSASEALALFERYTRAAPAGNLAEEALLGRAEALARLGRAADELEAWRTLLERFPQTAQRERAQARATALSTPL